MHMAEAVQCGSQLGMNERDSRFLACARCARMTRILAPVLRPVGKQNPCAVLRCIFSGSIGRLAQIALLVYRRVPPPESRAW